MPPVLRYLSGFHFLFLSVSVLGVLRLLHFLDFGFGSIKSEVGLHLGPHSSFVAQAVTHLAQKLQD